MLKLKLINCSNKTEKLTISNWLVHHHGVVFGHVVALLLGRFLQRHFGWGRGQQGVPPSVAVHLALLPVVAMGREDWVLFVAVRIGFQLGFVHVGFGRRCCHGYILGIGWKFFDQSSLKEIVFKKFNQILFKIKIKVVLQNLDWFAFNLKKQFGIS